MRERSVSLLPMILPRFLTPSPPLLPQVSISMRPLTEGEEAERSAKIRRLHAGGGGVWARGGDGEGEAED